MLQNKEVLSFGRDSNSLIGKKNRETNYLFPFNSIQEYKVIIYIVLSHCLV